MHAYTANNKSMVHVPLLHMQNAQAHRTLVALCQAGTEGTSPGHRTPAVLQDPRWLGTAVAGVAELHQVGFRWLEAAVRGVARLEVVGC